MVYKRKVESKNLKCLNLTKLGLITNLYYILLAICKKVNKWGKEIIGSIFNI